MIEALNHVMDRRRSIFPNTFTGELISKENIELLLSNANKVPSHKNTEPWRFHVVNPESRESFADFIQESYKTSMDDSSFKESKYSKLRKKVMNSSHIIIIAMKRDEKESVPEWEEVAAVACAVQNIYLTLTALSLGGYWSTPSHFIKNAFKHFNMEKNERCLGLFYIGQPQKILQPAKVKMPIEEKTKWY